MQFDIIKKTEFDKVLNSNLSQKQKSELFAAMCRYNCFVSVKKAGSGHLGSSFSAMDIVVYLYLNELNILELGTESPDRDIYFSSKGHDVPGLYAVFYALGFIDEKQLMSLRRIDGPDGHPDLKTKGIESNTGSLGMGISKGKGFAWAKKYSGSEGRVFVLTGDGEFQEGQIYESMQSTSHQKITNITVIVDRNKFQTDRLVDSINNIEDLSAKGLAFGWNVQRINGNNFDEIQNAIRSSKLITDKPKLIIADTVKGAGISFLESGNKDEHGELLYKWHSGAPDDEHFETGVNELKSRINKTSQSLGLGDIKFSFYEEFNKQSPLSYREYITDAFGDELCNLADERSDLVVMDADLSADCKLRKFEFKYPERFIENGIAEQDMVSMAGGLARCGLIPVVSSFASFLTSRANEQIYNNACEHTKIIYATHFAGMIPAGPGKSHQSVRDISLLGAIPNMTVIQPCNSLEMRLAVRYAVNDATENVALRMVIGPSPRKIELPENYSFKFGEGTVLTSGNDALVFAYGPVILHEILSAQEILSQNGFSLKVVNMPWLNKIESNWLIEVCSGINDIFVLEDHSNFGGLGDRILYELVRNGIKFDRFEKIGLDDYPACGVPHEVLKYHRLDSHSLCERITSKTIDKTESNHIYSVEAPQ
ncbi:MAG: 1-deoxy-D-xylulose-5-phosphate synthase [Candidatus Kapabacteria bacterium]|nr:1-deoxy-D-xylulose-5-phosphate synthase [Ignavibacteriota bacterium]MCW5884748.1 1-deoxy-D-xylulose-5-phosphate synthase [Candidatus Kapabacteria bacterium]